MQHKLRLLHQQTHPSFGNVTNAPRPLLVTVVHGSPQVALKAIPSFSHYHGSAAIAAANAAATGASKGSGAAGAKAGAKGTGANGAAAGAKGTAPRRLGPWRSSKKSISGVVAKIEHK